MYLSWLARTYAKLGKFDDAWRCIGEAVTLSKQGKKGGAEAEVHRMAGEIALRSPEPDLDKAETCFERALAVARQQHTKSWDGDQFRCVARQRLLFHDLRISDQRSDCGCGAGRRLQLTTVTRQHCAKHFQGRRRDCAPPPSRAHRQTGRKGTTACRIRKSNHPSRPHIGRRAAAHKGGLSVNSSWACDTPRRAYRPTETRRLLMFPTSANAVDTRTG
jgi:hypothetical protein